jgi:phosphoribosylformylglycinamidine synthase
VILLYQPEAGGVSRITNGRYAQDNSYAQSEWDIFRANMNALAALAAAGFVRSAYAVSSGGTAASLALMAFGNSAGLELCSGAFALPEGFCHQGSALLEIDGKNFNENAEIKKILAKAGRWEIAARTIAEPVFRIAEGAEAAEIPLATLRAAYESPLSRVYPQTSGAEPDSAAPPDILMMKAPAANSAVKQSIKGGASPLVILPVFPGTNCEWDMERAFREAGARTRLVVFRNRNRGDTADSIRCLAQAIGDAHILALSGGFSAGDEPEGSGKFIANVLRAPAVADMVADLLENRGGLILGICNGFQALIKLGLVPYGSYREASAGSPTLSFNRLGRHVSRMARTRVMSTASPWLALEEPGSVHIIPVSHGEGRLVIRHEEGETLFKDGQVPFCYADAEGRPASGEPDNPNGSSFAIEGLCSPDGRILGKMGHSERCGEFVHINIPGNKKQRIFEAGVKYFR